jgi:hypothetical protein
MEWGVLAVALLGVFLGFIVLQASLASRHWQRVIAEGDSDALEEALNGAFEGWRAMKPPAGLPPADWQGLQSATLIAADRDRCRVSLVAGADLRVVDNRRQEVGTALDVGRRTAVTMAERLLYDIPHVRFDEVQIDVYEQFHDQEGATTQRCLFTTRVDRSTAAVSDWEAGAADLLAEWNTVEATAGQTLDPDQAALIEAQGPGAVLPLEGAA